jgi:hypothetical protein
MEVDSRPRQSGILSLINREKVDRINLDTNDRSYFSTSGMAVPAVISPTSVYPTGPPPPYSSTWSGHNTMSGLISPSEPRRTSENKTEPPQPLSNIPPPHRQSLPSIQEAILNSGPKPSSFASPTSNPLQPIHQPPYQPQGPPTTIPRSYPDSASYQSQQPRQNSPPQPIHPQTPLPFPRSETISSFTEVRHQSISSLNGAPPPPPNPYAAPRNYPSAYEQDSRGPERLQSNGYTHYPPPQHSYGPPQVHSQGPISPPYHQPRYPQHSREPSDWSREDKKPEAFGVGLKRNLDVYDFENNLASINGASIALQKWSAHYNAIAQEQQRTASIPERMPTLDECNEMILQQEKIQEALHRMRETIYQQEHAMADQRMREQGKGTDYDPDDLSIYGDDMKGQGFGGSDGKKRRGRAAPPGRCHSCNRAETPEWRRGPDGARTLCNACGLHYAKLTRKNTLKQSQSNGTSLRPKSMDEHNTSPRPIS